MNKNLITKKRILWIALAVLLVPYLFSRMMSPSRRVAVYADASGAEKLRTTETLRVACFNIAHGRGLASSNWNGGTAAERMLRLVEIGDLLRKIDADVVVLNEVDFDSSWSHSVNQAEYLARRARRSLVCGGRLATRVTLRDQWESHHIVESVRPDRGHILCPVSPPDRSPHYRCSTFSNVSSGQHSTGCRAMTRAESHV